MSESAGALAKPAENNAAPSERATLTPLQRVVAWSAALLLLTAAMLKAWPMATGQSIDTQAASIGKLVLIQGEILLALWLMSGINAVWAFRAAMVFFAGAAVVNLRSIWLGEENCGCFGNAIEVSPFIVGGLDCLFALWFAKQQLGQRNCVSIFTVTRQRIVFLSLSIGTFTCIVMFESRGQQVVSSPRQVNFDDLRLKGAPVATVVLTNASDRLVAVTGYEASCSCVQIDGLPMVIPPHASETVTIRVTDSFNSSRSGVVRLYGDFDRAGEIGRIRYSGTITTGHIALQMGVAYSVAIVNPMFGARQ